LTVLDPAIERTRSGAEQRARTTAVAILAAAQNGTYACAHVRKDSLYRAAARSKPM
jgi:hypothetical protein